MLNIIAMGNHFLQNLSNNKYFIGLAMIFLNLGSRYVEVYLSSGQEKFVKSIAREALIFTMAFIGTRDITASLILTGAFIILANYVFNEESKFCVIPKYWSKKMKQAIDTDGDGQLSDEEIEHAIHILQKAKQDRINSNQESNYVSFIDKLP